MKKSLQRVLLGVAVGWGMIVGGIWLLSLVLGNNDESLYQGKPSPYWLEQLHSHDATASNQANAVLKLQIIPRLTEEMLHDTKDSHFRMALVETLNRLPGVAIGYCPAYFRRKEAAYELGEFGPAANAAIPGLVQTVKGNDGFSRYLAIIVLGNIHSEPEVVIPVLMPCLDDDKLNGAAAEALGEFGSLAHPAVPKLIPLLNMNDPSTRKAAWEALRNIDPEAANKAEAR